MWKGEGIVKKNSNTNLKKYYPSKKYFVKGIVQNRKSSFVVDNFTVNSSFRNTTDDVILLIKIF